MLYRTKNENVEIAKCKKHGNTVHRRYSRANPTWKDQLQCSQCRNEYETRRVRPALGHYAALHIERHGDNLGVQI